MEEVKELFKLDIGCGKNKKEGFKGLDSIKFEGVDFVHDVRTPWTMIEDNSVDEVHTSHFVEHLEARERVFFINELYRVMKVGAKCQIIVPAWSSNRAYGDMTHKWPPVSEMWFYYLSKDWRKTNCPHDDFEFNPDGYKCDFEATWGYSLNQALLNRNQEYQMHALTFWKESAQDIIATIIKK